MKTDPKTREAIVRELSIGFGFPAQEIDAVIRLESGWHWDAVNPDTKAEGLIQIMPFNFRRWGVRPGTIKGSRPKVQLAYIARYFRGVNADWKQPGDTYLAVAAPAAMGKPDSHVVYPVGSDAWGLNKGWREGKEGPITAGSIRQLLLRRMNASPKDFGLGLQPPREPVRSDFPAWGWLLALAAGAAVLAQGDD